MKSALTSHFKKNFAKDPEGSLVDETALGSGAKALSRDSSATAAVFQSDEETYYSDMYSYNYGSVIEDNEDGFDDEDDR